MTALGALRMPIYEYQCTHCDHQFDLMQKIKEIPVKQCPKCLEQTAVRLISAAGFQLKGDGWYATDFKNKGVAEKKTSPSAVDSASKSKQTKDSTEKSVSKTASTPSSKESKD